MAIIPNDDSCGVSPPGLIVFDGTSEWRASIMITLFDANVGPFGECVAYLYQIAIECAGAPSWLVRWSADNWATSHEIAEPNVDCATMTFTFNTTLADDNHPGVTSVTNFTVAP